MDCKTEFNRLNDIKVIVKGMNDMVSAISQILHRTLDAEKRSEEVDSLRKDLANARVTIGGLQVEQEQLTKRMDNAREFLQVLKVKHGVDFELIPSSQEQAND